MARFLIGLGLAILVLGLLWPYLSQLGLGRLPGDIVIERENGVLYFPLVTCLLLSLAAQRRSVGGGPGERVSGNPSATTTFEGQRGRKGPAMAQHAAQLDHLAVDRDRMVERQIAGRGVSDRRVLDAMREVPREAFVASGFEEFAYEDHPLPIEQGQTISQPYIVALMIEAAAVKPGDRVLEIGTGSGYAAAVLSRIAGKVYTVERHGALAETAQATIARASAIATSRCAMATAPWAGRRRHRSTPSS